MTREEFARAHDGARYPWDPPPDTPKNLLVVYGHSDDCVEFGGAWHDEVGPGTLYLHRHGVLPSHDDRCPCPRCGYQAAARACVPLTAEFGADGWLLSANAPCSSFTIVDEDEVYCQALVIDVIDLPDLDEGARTLDSLRRRLTSATWPSVAERQSAMQQLDHLEICVGRTGT